MIKKTFIIFLTLFVLGCSKNESASILGKWYAYSLDTKITHPPSCTLIDTTKYIVKGGLYYIEYEFLANGKANVTSYLGSTLYTSTTDYKFENNNLTIGSGGSNSAMVVSNLSAEGWRYLQVNRSYCTSPYTKFDEYYNFKKY